MRSEPARPDTPPEPDRVEGAPQIVRHGQHVPRKIRNGIAAGNIFHVFLQPGLLLNERTHGGHTFFSQSAVIKIWSVPGAQSVAVFFDLHKVDIFGNHPLAPAGQHNAVPNGIFYIK